MSITNMENVILHILIDLDMFSRLGPNLSIHLDRNNHFIVTSKYMANIYGAQTIANICKSHNTKKLVQDLNNFFKLIICILNTELGNGKNNNLESIKKISIICREFKLAYNGLPDVKDGGIFGLTETYKNDKLILQLKNTISFAKESIDHVQLTLAKLKLEELDKATLVKCPEIHFTDDDWHKVMNIIPSLEKEYVDVYKYYINYSSVLTLNIFNGYNWWDEIICFENNCKIYLGGLPIVQNFGRNDLQELQRLGINSVLSVIEIFENNSLGYMYSPVTPSDWKNANFKHYQIPSSDFCTMHLETLQKGVEFINWNIKNSRSIYVHCKSGKSRSFLIVVSYFVKYLGYTAIDALNYVKGKRIQAGFGKNSTKMEVLKKFEQLCK
jgi:protein-tyrosine phosphatase